eukprot:1380867-Amorphochlora_amoeboformis.AAC.1
MATVVCLLAALLAAQACGESIHRPGMKPTIKRVPNFDSEHCLCVLGEQADDGHREGVKRAVIYTEA